MSEINRIYVNSSLTIESGFNNTLCFVDGKLIEKSRYTLENNELTIYREARDYVSLFYSANVSKTYYFEKVLDDYGIVVFGKDAMNNELTGMRNNNTIVFIDGVLLSKDEYTVLDGNNIALLTIKNDTKFHDVIVYVSSAELSYGVLNDPTNSHTVSNDTGERINCPENAIGYKKENTLVFQNGKLIPPTRLKTVDGYTSITYLTETKPGSIVKDLYTVNSIPIDKFEYYKFSDSTSSLNFASINGITTYGPKDDYGVQIPLLYDSSVLFDDLVKVLIDDLRPGFVIYEKDRAGRILIVDTDYESRRLKTLTLVPFSGQIYSKNDYYLEVPEAKNIVDYLSDFDKKFTMLPEILRIFQRVILDEIHDEVERLKNIRNIKKVDSAHVHNLLRLLGMDLDIKHLNLKQMQEAMEELNEFYRIAGTKDSLNYFNIVQDNTKLIDIKQLFTFHKTKPKSKDSDKIYSYDYSIYQSAGTIYNGSGYLKGEQYRLVSSNDEDTGIIIKIDDVDVNGGLVENGFSTNTQEGQTAFSTAPFKLKTNSTGAKLKCDSIPYLYNYSSVVTTGASGGFTVGEVLTTPLFDGTIIVDAVDEGGHITSSHPSKTTGRTSYNNIKDTPLQSESIATNLQLLLNAKDETVTEVFRDTRSGNNQYKIDETAIYEITISGAGGSGGAADTSIGSINDSPASSGCNGEEITKRIICSKGTTISYSLGEGGKPSWAKGHDGARAGAGGSGNTSGAMGYTKTDNIRQTEGSWTYRHGGLFKHILGSDFILNKYTVNNTTTNASVVYSRAASGAGGGGSSFSYNGSEWKARGGDGGTATWASKNNQSNVVLQGGTGGNGGTKTGMGAKGGGRNDDNTFYSKPGEGGYIIIKKITQNYTADAQLLHNVNTGLSVGTKLKTTDNWFDVDITEVVEGRVTKFTVTPSTGIKPIFNKKSNGEIINYQKTFDLINTTKEAKLTLVQSVNSYKYQLTIDTEGGLYIAGQTLVDEDEIFTINITEVDNTLTGHGKITSFTYSPMQGTENINFTGSELTSSSGQGAYIVINSSADVNIQNIEREYVDFYLPEEQGAIPHKEYRYPTLDYGLVNQGSPGSPWPWIPGEADIDYGMVNQDSPNAPFPSETKEEGTWLIPDTTNITYDHEEEPHHTGDRAYDIYRDYQIKAPIGIGDIDYGEVSQRIKGQWVEWWEWDRPADLYPTNHVEVEINILSVEDYEEAMDRFYRQFYSLASAVLYIHRLITVYNFGNNTTASITPDNPNPSENMVLLGFMTTQPFDYEVHSLTSESIDVGIRENRNELQHPEDLNKEYVLENFVVDNELQTEEMCAYFNITINSALFWAEKWGIGGDEPEPPTPPIEDMDLGYIGDEILAIKNLGLITEQIEETIDLGNI